MYSFHLKAPYRDHSDTSPPVGENLHTVYDESSSGVARLTLASAPRTSLMAARARQHRRVFVAISAVTLCAVLISIITIATGGNHSAPKQVRGGVLSETKIEEWTMASKEIIGPIQDNAGLGYGHALAMSANGRRLAVGLQGFGYKNGLVDVYSWQGHTKTWLLEHTFIDRHIGTYHSPHEALSISADGGRIALSEEDKVAVYGRYTDETDYSWQPLGIPIDPFRTSEISQTARFGSKVVLSDDGNKVIAIGDSESTGLVEVYQYKEIDNAASGRIITWELVDSIRIDHGGGDISVSHDASIIAVGTSSSTYPNHEEQSGVVQVFALSPYSGRYERLGQAIAGEALGEGFGGSVSLSSDGKHLAAGTEEGSDNIVRLYMYDAVNETWMKCGDDLRSSQEGRMESFGASLELNTDGSMLAVGAPGTLDRFGDSIPGSVHIFQVQDVELHSWTQVGYLESPHTGDLFGTAVAMSMDGTRIVASAPRRSYGGNEAVGIIEVYDRPLDYKA